MGRRAPRLSIAFVVLAASAPVWAQPSDPAEQGRAALEAFAFEEAIRHFRYGLNQAEPGPDAWRMLLGLALSYEAQGDAARAASCYATFLERSFDIDDAWARKREQAAKDLATQSETIAESHVELIVRTEPGGAHLSLQGLDSPIERTPAVAFVDPFTPSLRLTRPGYQPVEITLALQASDEPVLVEQTLAPLRDDSPEGIGAPVAPAHPVSAMTVAPPPLSEPQSVDDRNPSKEGPVWVPIAIGVGIGLSTAAFTTGAVLTATAFADADEVQALQAQPGTLDNVNRDRELRSRIEDLQTGAAVLYVLGGTLIAASTSLWIYEASRTGERVEVGITPGGLDVSARF